MRGIPQSNNSGRIPLLRPAGEPRAEGEAQAFFEGHYRHRGVAKHPYHVVPKSDPKLEDPGNEPVNASSIGQRVRAVLRLRGRSAGISPFSPRSSVGVDFGSDT